MQKRQERLFAPAAYLFPSLSAFCCSCSFCRLGLIAFGIAFGGIFPIAFGAVFGASVYPALAALLFFFLALFDFTPALLIGIIWFSQCQVFLAGYLGSGSPVPGSRNNQKGLHDSQENVQD